MASESIKNSESNSLKTDSTSSSNTGEGNILETLNFSEKNNNTLIKRVWIVKKSIDLNDIHIRALNTLFFYEDYIFIFDKLHKAVQRLLLGNKILLKQYQLNMVKNEIKLKFKHWAIILDLSNKAYINIQFGRNGFSLNEFNDTEKEEENVFDAILDTWGNITAPFSLCFLGNANFEYEKLKEQLNVLKE